MLKRLTISGFQSHKHSELEFSPGVNVITGKSHSGKSAILRSLQWLRFNRPSGTKFVNSQVDDCYIEVETTEGIARRCRTPFNGYVVDGVEFRSIGSTVPQELDKVFPLEEINFQSQIKGQYFLVFESPGQISKSISDTLGFRVVDLFISNGKRAVADAQSEYVSLNTKIAETEKVAQRLERLGDIRPSLMALEGVEKRLEDISKLLNSLEKLVIELNQVDKLEDLCTKGLSGVDFDQCDVTLQVLDQLAAMESLVAEIKGAEASVGGFDAQLKSLCCEVEAVKSDYVAELCKLGVCPYCLTTVSDEVLRGVVAAL